MLLGTLLQTSLNMQTLLLVQALPVQNLPAQLMPSQTSPAQFLPLLPAMAIAGLMTLGWSLMLNVPKQNLWQCVLITAVGYGLRNTLLGWHYSLIFATFFAAMLSSALGIYLSKRYLITPKAVIVPGLICMMPGISAYKAMVSLIQIGYYGYSAALFDQMMHYFVNAMFVIGALVVGLSLPATIFYRNRPIV